MFRVVEVPERHSDDPLVVERVLRTGMSKAPPHVHLDFAERYEVLSGVADARMGDESLRVNALPGRSVLWVGQGQLHVNPHNADVDDLHLRQSFQPATDGVRAYVATLVKLLAEGRDHNGDVPWSLVLAIADVTRERSYFGSAGYGLQRRVLLPLGSMCAGTRGYDVWLTRSARK